MQTLRKRTSPCKYKNDPSRFLGEGITFKAKLIGILEVSEARGDKMCQDALNDLKTAIRAAGEHKQRITISISIDGLKLRDEKTGDCLYHHPVHKISFIAQDMSDSRAFGYIFGSPDTGHRFFGIKTDKTASQVVISMRDLFQVVFELKKKEIEMAKHHTEHHHTKYGSTGYLDSLHFSKNNSEPEKAKAKYSQMTKPKCMSSKTNEPFAATDLRGAAAEAIADLLDLEHELNNIQQGINQMEKITPPDPFGPLSKGDSYDPFDDSFSSKIDQPLEEKSSLITKPQIQTEDTKEVEKNSLFLSSIAADKTNFFPQFSPTKNKSQVEDDKWFENEREAFFDETTHVNDIEFTTSPAALNNSGSASEQGEGRRSPVKIDLFTELDPLGTGRVKPYVDKKDFFQELKNPPKKLLKEMIVDTTSTELSVLYFPAQHREKTTSVVKSEGYAHALDSAQTLKESTFRKNYTNIDPFEDGDPFEKTDPFQEENFPTSEAFVPLFGAKTSTSDNFDEKTSWRFDGVKESAEERFDKDFSATLPLFSSSTLKVSLPPENLEIKSFVASSKICKLKSPPNSPEDSKTIPRKIGQILKQNDLEKGEEIAVHEKTPISIKVKNSESRFEADNFSSSIKFFTAPGAIDKIRSSNETLAPSTPDPPPRTKAALFSIKPPPLPPKKQIQLITKPPARPPSSEDSLSHYDYLKQKEVLKNDSDVKEELKCVKLKQQLFSAKEAIPKEPKKKPAESGFPVLPPPPPQKKISHDFNRKSIIRKDEGEKEDATIENEGSILNIKLRQLDKTGLENLAMTLGIPLENIYCMTLQDLTKMLADKYLPSSSKKPENRLNESFEVDFESNFANTYTNEENTTYDKYAVFKELIKSENELEQNDTEKVKKGNLCGPNKNGNTKGDAPQEEDKYAALRLLSLNSQSNQFSADDDDEDYNTAMKTDKICDSNSSIEKLPFHANDLKSEKVVENLENKIEKPEEKITESGGTEDLARIKSPEFDTETKTNFTNENRLFADKDVYCNANNTCLDRNNWATFDKLNFEETITKKSSDLFEENENSPFSSDGKEELREIPFCWHENDFSKQTRKDVPWRDEDESWEEDYSPKESFCSDESSHEEHSPKDRRDEIFIKQRNKRGVCAKTSRNKNNKNNHWSHREKWQEETEDEFEGSWRKQRGKTSSYDSERKNTWRGNSREECNKHCDWSNSRDGSRIDEKRHSHYLNRYKRSESDNEYRKRCDSDTSEKECAWTFRKNCPESHGRSEKTKQYHSSDFSFRDCPEYCHKSRSKHRRGTFQKRPNSASESKRNSEKSFFSPGHSIRDGDKTYPGKKESNINEFFKCDHGFKDSRYLDDVGFERFCSHDRKEPSHHSKSCCRNSRRPSEIYSPLGKRFETSNIQNEDYQFYGRGNETKYDKTSDERFNFDGEIENFGNSSRTERESSQSFAKSSDRRQKLFNSRNDKISGNGFFPFANNNENAANFKDFNTCPSKSDGKPEGMISDPKKSQSKNQLVDPELQASSNTLRKSDSINIFFRDKDPFEGDDFFNSVS